MGMQRIDLAGQVKSLVTIQEFEMVFSLSTMKQYTQ